MRIGAKFCTTDPTISHRVVTGGDTGGRFLAGILLDLGVGYWSALRLQRRGEAISQRCPHDYHLRTAVSAIVFRPLHPVVSYAIRVPIDR